MVLDGHEWKKDPWFHVVYPNYLFFISKFWGDSN